MEIPVFISHSWAYPGHYNKLAEWIFGRTWISNGQEVKFVNQSVPKTDPIHSADNAYQLEQAIFSIIRTVRVVVIPTGMYTTHSKWISREIAGAKKFRKPILAVNPWGQERKSSIVIEKAADIVGWNSDSVVNGIWKLNQNPA